MTLTISEAIEETKRIIAADLEVALQRESVKAIQGHKLARPNKYPSQTTGNLTKSINTRVNGGEIEVSFPFYAKYLEWGTGIYSEHPQATEQVIRPKHGKALAWGKTIGRTKDGRPKKEFVFKYIKGMTPAPFIRPVMHQKFISIVTNALNEAFRDVYL